MVSEHLSLELSTCTVHSRVGVDRWKGPQSALINWLLGTNLGSCTAALDDFFQIRGTDKPTVCKNVLRDALLGSELDNLHNFFPDLWFENVETVISTISFKFEAQAFR